MCQYLKHRGPDYEEVSAPGENIALGHRALFVEDSGREHQPLSSEDETVWVTFDGTIYNFEQLEKKLERNHEFRSRSSAELVIHAYEEEGLNCVREFNGDFAFCLWDSKKRLLFSARDKIGIRPLYYYNNGYSDRFLISSEIKALLVDPLVPRKPNKRIIYEYLLNGPQCHTGDTFFEGIKELLPAHFVLVNQNGVEVQRYWSPLQSSRTGTAEDENCADYACRFLELFRDSVKIRIPENPVIGTFLSGGIDSSSVACLTDRILRMDSSGSSKTRQELFSAVYPNTEADEKAYAEEVARAVNCRINYLQPSVSGQWDDIKKFVYYMDEPVPVFNYYAYWCLSRAASSRVRVAFSGQGPDEILGGHAEERIAYFKELWKRKKIPRLFVELIGSLTQYKISKILAYDIRGLLFRNGKSKSAMKKLFARELAGAIVPDETLNNGESLNEFLFKEVTQTLLLDHLQFGDRASAAFSTETRYPFLDCRIVEFVFKLPPSQKIKNGWTKYVLREAMKGIIPEAIRKRRKKLGTPIPLEKWLIDLEKEIKANFGSRKFRERGYFNQPAVLDMYDRFCRGKMNRFDKTLYADVFWRILNLELWFEVFFD
jgi:asparagine synthase (glutamine-hydrolysing)